MLLKSQSVWRSDKSGRFVGSALTRHSLMGSNFAPAFPTAAIRRKRKDRAQPIHTRRTKRTCAHAAIADAAYFCICGRDKSAPLFPPPDRSLASIIFAQAETAPSLQVCQTNETKTQISSNQDTTASPIASGDDSLTKCSPKTMGTTLVF